MFACIFQGIKSHKIYFVYRLSKPFFNNNSGDLFSRDNETEDTNVLFFFEISVLSPNFLQPIFSKFTLSIVLVNPFLITILATFFHETMKLKIPMYFFSLKSRFYLPIFYSLFFKYTLISDCLRICQ